MKTIFSLAVLIAVIYLFLPQNTLEKLSAFMPKQQIEQAAEAVLSDVDLKLEQFKSKLLITQNNRITDLEKQLASLQEQLQIQADKIALVTTRKKEQIVFTKQTTMQTPPITGEMISANTATVPKFITIASTEIEGNEIALEKSAKQQAINRQAYLQDLAERMNKTSLHTLTK